MKQQGIFDKEICYLSDDAARAVQELVEQGIDRDLAIALLEGFYGEAIYELPSKEEGGSTL